MCSPMPTKPAAPRRTRCLERRTKSAPSSKLCRDVGVDYVLLTISGGREQLRRFAREIMPAVARFGPAADAAE